MKTEKKILLLGGSEQQIIAIKTAKRLGYYTVLCDYLIDNPGQYHADKFYLESTTDPEAILHVAEKERVSGILAYASDPAAPTAAYVAEKLGLPGNPYESVKILCEKDLFRDFLSRHNFNTPFSKGYDEISSAVKDLENNVYKLPVIIKPVDSSGSKGVSRVDDLIGINEKLQYAMQFSKKRRIIIEEWVEKNGYQVAGDGLSIDGKLVFRYFGNDHFDERCENPFVPIAASFPYNMPDSVHDKIHETIQRLLTELNMKTCTYNFDIRIDKDYNVYLMEVAPRSGGNYIPNVIKYATGVDLVEYSVRAAMGEKISAPKNYQGNGYWSYFAVHSLNNGILDSITIRDELIDKIIENHIIKQKGNTISSFVGANSTLGCLIMKFKSMDEMLDMMDRSDRWISVNVSK